MGKRGLMMQGGNQGMANKTHRLSSKAKVPLHSADTLEMLHGGAGDVVPPVPAAKPVSKHQLNRTAERQLIGDYTFGFGVDEAGRGPLAGPVVIAACWIADNVVIDGIMDSKQVNEANRETAYEVLINHPDVKWATAIVEHTEIDTLNILQATMVGMERASESLLQQFQHQQTAAQKAGKSSKPKQNCPTFEKNNCIALIDGNRCPHNMPCASKYVIKGDGSIYSIAAASIIAKVTRDRIMLEMNKLYPIFELAKHKGYPTASHRQILLRVAPSPIHRLSFRPVRESYEKFCGDVPVYVVVPSTGSTATATKTTKSKANPTTTKEKSKNTAPSKNKKDTDVIHTTTSKPAATTATMNSEASTNANVSAATNTESKCTRLTRSMYRKFRAEHKR